MKTIEKMAMEEWQKMYRGATESVFVGESAAFKQGCRAGWRACREAIINKYVTEDGYLEINAVELISFGEEEANE